MACSINDNLSQYTQQEQDQICFDELQIHLFSKQQKFRPPNTVQQNTIYLQMSIDKIVAMDQKNEATSLLGYLVTRWQDWRLTWNPAEWAGIEMFQINAYEIWKPDLIIYNELNQNMRNYTTQDSHQVRVWADRASMNDVPEEKFNIEWTPTLKLEFFHQQDGFQYPLDIQTISLEIHPWMSITNQGQNKLKMLKEASTLDNSQSSVQFSGFFNEEERYMLLEGSETSQIYSQMWNNMEFNIMFVKFQIQRQDQKFFSCIYFPLVFLLILSTLNIAFCSKDNRVRNSVMLLVSSSVQQTILQNSGSKNTKFGLFESILYANNQVTFVSNCVTIIEYQYEFEQDLITELSKEFYDKGRIYNDDSISNKFRQNYKNISFQNIRKYDLLLNIFLIGLNFIVFGTQFKNDFYKYAYYTVLISLTIIVLIQVSRNINSLQISHFIYKIQYLHKINSNEIEKELIKYYSEFENASIKDVADEIQKIQDPQFNNKDKENLNYTIQLIVSQFSEKQKQYIERNELSLLITSLSCDIKNLDTQTKKQIQFNHKLEKENFKYKNETNQVNDKIKIDDENNSISFKSSRKNYKKKLDKQIIE